MHYPEAHVVKRPRVITCFWFLFRSRVCFFLFRIHHRAGSKTHYRHRSSLPLPWRSCHLFLEKQRHQTERLLQHELSTGGRRLTMEDPIPRSGARDYFGKAYLRRKTQRLWCKRLQFRTRWPGKSLCWSPAHFRSSEHKLDYAPSRTLQQTLRPGPQYRRCRKRRDSQSRDRHSQRLTPEPGLRWSPVRHPSQQRIRMRFPSPRISPSQAISPEHQPLL